MINWLDKLGQQVGKILSGMWSASTGVNFYVIFLLNSSWQVTGFVAGCIYVIIFVYYSFFWKSYWKVYISVATRISKFLFLPVKFRKFPLGGL